MNLLQRLATRFFPDAAARPGASLDPALHDLKRCLGPMLELLERAPVGVMVVGSDLRVIYANAHQVAMHGYSREELLRMRLPDLVAPSRRENIPARMAQVRAQGGGTFDSWHLNKAGEPLHLSIMVMPVIWDGEEAVISVHANLTELDRSHAALRESELQHRNVTARMDLALSAASMGIWDWDIVGDQLTWDDQMYALYGLEPGAFGGAYQAWLNQVHPDDRAQGQAASRQALDGTKDYDEEFRVLWPDGSVHHLKARAKVLRNAQGAPQRMIGVNFDITARKTAELERAALLEKHLESQKLEAIGSLAGGVAHDFNNLLSVIMGYAELAKSGLPAGAEELGYLKEVERAARAAAELTQQLLAFGRKQMLLPVPLDMNRAVGDVVKMLRRVLGENIDIVVRRAEGLGLVRADPGQITQVLMNLMINARDAMPQGGTLTLETAVLDLGPAESARYDGLDAGPHVAVSVRDTGTGMDATTKARIWEPFFTTKAIGKGTGLGLPTVYGIIKQSRGDILLETAPGKGSCFTFLLPQVQAEAEASAPNREPDLRGRGQAILLVEDERALRVLTAELLSNAGYQVLVAESAEAALALMAATELPIDLLLTDVLLPGKNGAELALLLSRQRPGLRVLFMSGYPDDALEALGPRQRDAPLLAKPFDIQSLGRKVREALLAPPNFLDA